MNNKFVNLIPGTLDYHITKLRETNLPAVMASVHLKTLSDVLNKIETVLQHSFGDVDGYPELQDNLDNTASIINEYHYRLSQNRKFKVKDKREFSDKLRENFLLLRDSLCELNEG